MAVTADMAGSESPVFEHEVADELTEQVIRGDLKLVKVGEGDQGRMAGVPFLASPAPPPEATPSSPTPAAAHHTPRRGAYHTADANGGFGAVIVAGVWTGRGAEASPTTTPSGARRAITGLHHAFGRASHLALKCRNAAAGN
ncbi:MAG: hypothetical protein ACLTDR_12685 [Adlercreutzia equolifaciens]